MGAYVTLVVRDQLKCVGGDTIANILDVHGYLPRDEGLTWIRGQHSADSEEGAALLAAAALVAEPPQPSRMTMSAFTASNFPSYTGAVGVMSAMSCRADSNWVGFTYPSVLVSTNKMPK